MLHRVGEPHTSIRLPALRYCKILQCYQPQFRMRDNSPCGFLPPGCSYVDGCVYNIVNIVCVCVYVCRYVHNMCISTQIHTYLHISRYVVEYLICKKMEYIIG